MGDSFYEYLLKVWVQGDRTEKKFREWYDRSADGIVEVLMKESSPSHLRYLADWKGGNRIDPKMDHLVCFAPGMYALGYHTSADKNSKRAKRDLRVAKQLMYTCWQMYERMETGIAAEYVKFTGSNDFITPQNHYLLRPETVESLFILNQVTGNPIYRIWGKRIMDSIEKYCRVKFGYGALSNVHNVNQKPRDSMESFFLAETLKYLFLLQDPDVPIDLNEWVFNTEAHPLKIFK